MSPETNFMQEDRVEREGEGDGQEIGGRHGWWRRLPDAYPPPERAQRAKGPKGRPRRSPKARVHQGQKAPRPRSGTVVILPGP